MRQGCFRPLGPVGGSSSQCQGVAGCASVSPPLSVLSVRDHGGRVLRLCHRGRLSAQGGGTRSPALNTIGQEILRWAESLRIRLALQFILGIRNVLADSLSRPHQLPSSEWSLNMDVFRSLTRQWPVMINLFAISDNHRCSIYFSPYRDPLTAGTDALLQSWDGHLAVSSPGVGEASGVSPDPPHPRHPLLASASLVHGPPPVVGGSSSDSFSAPRPPLPALVSSTLPRSPQAGPSCLETVQRFTRVAGFSSAVAAQASLACRPSSRSNYQLKWSVYRSWCRSQGHSISRPSLQGGVFPLVAPLGSGP